MDGRAAAGEDKTTADWKKRLTSILEYGQDAALESELDDVFAQVRERRLFTSIMLCSNLLRDMLRVFHVQGYSAYTLLDFAAPPPDGREELERMTREGFRLLLKTLRSQAETPATVLVVRAKRLIEENYADAGFSLSALADQLNLSYNYLSTLFSKETGTSLKSYLTAVRMEKARSLILERRHKVYAVAQMVGYSNPRYFTDAFRKHFHTSPTEYSQSIGGGYDEN